jgi:hypothetical protein
MPLEAVIRPVDERVLVVMPPAVTEMPPVDNSVLVVIPPAVTEMPFTLPSRDVVDVEFPI